MRYLFLMFCTAICAGQSYPKTDFTKLDATLAIDTISRSVSGHVTYTFEVRSQTDTIFIDAKNMSFSNVRINNRAVPFKSSGKHLKLYTGYKKGTNLLTFDYSATPKQTLYFVRDGKHMQIWTQGQGKYTSHWLPSFDDVNEKLVFNLSVKFNSNYTVIANGLPAPPPPPGFPQGPEKISSFYMDKPMSSYLVMLAIGRFDSRTQRAASGVPLHMYIREQDSDKYEPTYRYTKEIFDFMEKEIGVAYPWHTYSQVPVMDFLYGGMENTSATIFAQHYVVDSIGFNDRDYINVNAHELAHQWFGDLVTATEGKHHWLQEGFATYYALLAERELFGDDYFYHRLYENAEQLQRAAASDKVPLMNEKASTLTFYQKGAWALHVIRESIGEDAFRKAVKEYLRKHSFKNVETDDFLKEIAKVSSFDILKFKKEWLEDPGFRIDEAIVLLKKNRFINEYFDLLALHDTPLQQKEKHLLDVLASEAYYPMKEEVVYQLRANVIEEKKKLLEAAMATGDLKVRQAVAATLNEIPAGLYQSYASLLQDRSYITREIALSRLWAQFPEKQCELLDATKHYVGFQDKNLRILWLTLALSTSEYEPAKKTAFYEELLHYAAPDYESTIRQNALQSLLYRDKNDTNALTALVDPLSHHKWQFTKYARDKIRELIREERYAVFYNELLPTLSERDRAQLSKLLTK